MDVSQDRNSSFEPKIVKKHKKDISGIENKALSMHAKGMTATQISLFILPEKRGAPIIDLHIRLSWKNAKKTKKG